MTELAVDILPWSLSGPVRGQRLYVAALALLVVGTLAAVVGLRRPELDVTAAAIAAGSVTAWLLSNAAAEGATLLVVRPGNGLTLADVAVLPAVALTAQLCWRRLRAARPGG